MFEERLSKFADLFRGFDQAYSRRQRKHNGQATGAKQNSSPVFIKEPVTDEVYESHLRGDFELGLAPATTNNECWFACIDIDNYDKSTDHAAIAKEVEKFGGVVCASKSFGAHVFFFFSEPIPADEVYSKIGSISAALGYSGLSGGGKVDLFPSGKNRSSESTGGKTITLPMHYSYGDGAPLPFYTDNKQNYDLDDFLALAEKQRMSRQQFNALKTTTKSAEQLFQDGPPCLQAISSNGKLGDGEARNNLMFNVGVFLIKSVSEGDQKDDRWKTALLKYNEQMCDPPLEYGEISKVIESLSRNEFSYKCSDRPICNFCDRPKCLTRKFGVGSSGALLPHLHSMVKVMYDEYYFHVTVDGQRIGPIRLVEAETYTTFRRMLMRECSIRMPQARSKQLIEVFDSKWAELEANCEEITFPTKYKLQVIYQLLHEYSSLSPTTEEYNALHVALRSDYGAMDKHGNFYFRPVTFMRYCNERRMNLTGAMIDSQLQELGAQKVPYTTSVMTCDVFKIKLEKEHEA